MDKAAYEATTRTVGKWIVPLGKAQYIERELNSVRAELEKQRDAALASLAELHAALVRYEGDVDGEAPSEHRRMMNRAAQLGFRERNRPCARSQWNRQ